MRAVLVMAAMASCSTNALDPPPVTDGDVSSLRDFSMAPDLTPASGPDGAADLQQGDLAITLAQDLSGTAVVDMATVPRDFAQTQPDLMPLPDLAVACLALQTSCNQGSGCCQDGVACTYVDGVSRCCNPLGASCGGLADCCAPSGVMGLTCYVGMCCAISYITTGCAAGKHKVCAECPAGIVNCASTCT